MGTDLSPAEGRIGGGGGRVEGGEATVVPPPRGGGVGFRGDGGRGRVFRDGAGKER